MLAPQKELEPGEIILHRTNAKQPPPIFFFFFFEEGFSNSHSWPGTHSRPQWPQTYRDPPASACWVLELKESTTTATKIFLCQNYTASNLTTAKKLNCLTGFLNYMTCLASSLPKTPSRNMCINNLIMWAQRAKSLPRCPLPGEEGGLNANIRPTRWLISLLSNICWETELCEMLIMA